MKFGAAGTFFPSGPRVFALAAGLVLAGCSSAPLAVYDLVAQPAVPGASQGRLTMVVSEPLASAPLDSDRIVVRTGDESLALLSGAQWADRLPRLVQTRIIQTFENSRRFGAVGRPGERFNAQLELGSDIRRFDIDATRREAVIEISARLTTPSGTITRARIFAVTAPAAATDGSGATAALNEAFAQIVRDMTAWATGGS